MLRSTKFNGDIPKDYQSRRFYTPNDVAKHNTGHDCWVSFFGGVYDLTTLIQEHSGPLSAPIIDASGSDITHWFDPETKAPKKVIDPVTLLPSYYCPNGRYIHIPPPMPTDEWSTNFGTPWWFNKEKFLIGTLSQHPRVIGIMNVINEQLDFVEVASEETLSEILNRYLPHNVHAASYTWKRLTNVLDMNKTLEENGVPDEGPELDRLGVDPKEHIPVLHLYFNDDLTSA